MESWPNYDGGATGIRFYSYVNGDPINNVDPLGLIARPSVPSPTAPDTPSNPSPGSSSQCNNAGSPIQQADYYNHAIQRMNQRGISPAQVEHALQYPSTITEQENGNTLTEGENGVSVVTDPYGWIVTVW